MTPRLDEKVRSRFVVRGSLVAVVAALAVSGIDLWRGNPESLFWNVYYLGTAVAALGAFAVSKSRVAWAAIIGHVPIVHLAFADSDIVLLAYFWVYVFPLVLFFVLGVHRGAAMVGTIFVGVAAVAGVRGPEAGLGEATGDMVLSFGVVCFLAGLYEFMRDKYAARIEELAVTDPLTGAANRRKFEDTLRWELARAQRYERPLSVLMLDLDKLKPINDTHGHAAGDRVLVELADLVRAAVRQTDCFARLGGDEFVILLPETHCDPTKPDDALELAARLRRAVAEHDFGLDRSVTVSMGLAEYGPDDTLETLMARADQALYRAKDQGRNQAVAA